VDCGFFLNKLETIGSGVGRFSGRGAEVEGSTLVGAQPPR